jgi:hypothetical protein
MEDNLSFIIQILAKNSTGERIDVPCILGLPQNAIHSVKKGGE